MLLRFALAFSLITPLLHVLVLLSSTDVSYQDPIALLSHGNLGVLHTLSLALFGAAQVLLAQSLAGADHGWFWPLARGLLALAGVGVFFVAYSFAASAPDAPQGTEALDPLWIVACLIGFSMGLFQPGLNRYSKAMARINAACFAAWCLLVPATLLIGFISLGFYERVVGLVYVSWVAGLCLLELNPPKEWKRGEAPTN